MKKVIFFVICLFVLLASSVALAGSDSLSPVVLRHSAKPVDKVETTMVGSPELECIDSNCLYLPLIVKPGIGPWVTYSMPVLEPGPSGEWDDTYVICPEILFDGTQYRMWYSGGGENGINDEIGYATSIDGINWEKHLDNPVLKIGESGKWDDKYIREPVVLTDGSTWKMWYEGVNELTGSHQIGFATSQDGISWWKFDGNPVLSSGPSGSWDAQGIRGPYVILKQDDYHMWYYNSGIVGSIGYASSSEGITWTKLSGNPILIPPIVGVVYNRLKSPSVIEISGEYNMWIEYSMADRADYYQNDIVHKTSLDGINWVAGSSTLPRENWMALHFCPEVILHNNSVKMWYTMAQKIYYAEAPLIP